MSKSLEKYGIEPPPAKTMHAIDSFKDCVMAKLRYAKHIDFKTAVRACRPMADTQGMDFDKQNKRFFRALFTELTVLENAGFIKVAWEPDPEKNGKNQVKDIALEPKGEKWLETNDFSD